MTTLRLSIEGMDCKGCATGIQLVTERIDGVSNVFLDFDGKNGVWELDQSKVSPEIIIQEISSLGYKASVI